MAIGQSAECATRIVSWQIFLFGTFYNPLKWDVLQASLVKRHQPVALTSHPSIARNWRMATTPTSTTAGGLGVFVGLLDHFFASGSTGIVLGAMASTWCVRRTRTKAMAPRISSTMLKEWCATGTCEWTAAIGNKSFLRKNCMCQLQRNYYYVRIFLCKVGLRRLRWELRTWQEQELRCWLWTRQPSPCR